MSIAVPAQTVPASRRDKVKLSALLLLAPAVLWLGLLIVVPHLRLLDLALSVRVGPGQYAIGFDNFLVFVGEPLYWRTFLRTAVFSILTTAMTLLLAFPIAWYIVKLTRGWSKGMLFAACLLPFWVSEIVRLLGWMVLLRESGLVSQALIWLGLRDTGTEFLYNDGAMVLGLTYGALLFMVVPLVNVLDTLDDAQVEAGYDLGGNAFTIFRDIVVPHALPGIVSGCVVVFMLTLGNYATATLMGGKNSLWFTEQIYNQFIVRFNWEQGAAFGILLLLLSSAIVWAGLRLSGQSLGKTMGN